MTSETFPQDCARPMIALLLCSLGCVSAHAADAKLVCLLEDSVTHAQRTLEVVFNERAQYVTVNGKTAIADISNTSITFRVELAAGAPLDFAVDRASGAINITSTNSSAKTKLIYTGQCKATDPS
jgi:hypothetical protein